MISDGLWCVPLICSSSKNSNIAGGKGWGNFDMQLTFSVTLPTGDVPTLGTPLLTNLVFQYHLLELLWPEVEVNYTYWPNGTNRGKNQVFLTPRVVLGVSGYTGD